MNWLQLGGSIVAILVLAGIAWALGLGRGEIGDEAAAMRTAEDALSGFDADRAMVGSDGRATLLYGIDGRVAVIKLHGAHPAVRLVSTMAVSGTDQGWTIETGDRWFGRVVVTRGSDRQHLGSR